MSNSFASRSPWPARLLALLRMVVGVLFILHGTQKLFGVPPSPAVFPLTSQLGIAALLELTGGLLLLAGLFVRPVAFLLSGEMAFAYWIGHSARGAWPILNGGEPAVIYCFLFLYMSAAGGGTWTLGKRR